MELPESKFSLTHVLPCPLGSPKLLQRAQDRNFVLMCLGARLWPGQYHPQHWCCSCLVDIVNSPLKATKSDDVKSDDVNSDEVNSNNVKMGNIKSSDVKSDDVKRTMSEVTTSKPMTSKAMSLQALISQTLITKALTTKCQCQCQWHCQWRKVLWLFRQERAFRLVLISCDYAWQKWFFFFIR